MSVLTNITTIAPQSNRKPFSWSYSKLKNFESCPLRHQQVDLLKTYREGESEQLQWGNALHAAMAARLKSGTPLPLGMTQYEKWCAKVEAMAGDRHVEMSLAINRDFGPCGYLDRTAWFRCKVDVAVVPGMVAWAGDWKTGKILEDPPQLALTAACLFAHQPQLRAVKTNFIWLKDDAAGVDEVFRRENMPAFWAQMLPRVAAMERAYETGEYQPMPGRLCRNWCPVRACKHHGT